MSVLFHHSTIYSSNSMESPGSEAEYGCGIPCGVRCTFNSPLMCFHMTPFHPLENVLDHGQWQVCDGNKAVTTPFYLNKVLDGDERVVFSEPSEVGE